MVQKRMERNQRSSLRPNSASARSMICATSSEDVKKKRERNTGRIDSWCTEDCLSHAPIIFSATIRRTVGASGEKSRIYILSSGGARRGKRKDPPGHWPRLEARPALPPRRLELVRRRPRKRFPRRGTTASRGTYLSKRELFLRRDVDR